MRRESIALGLVLLVAGLHKVADPGHFQATLSSYGLFPAPLLPYVAPLPIVGEMSLGLALLSGLRPRRCLALCEALFYSLSLAIASMFYRGLQIRCACFGLHSLKVSPLHSVVCLAVALYLSYRRSHPLHRRA